LDRVPPYEGVGSPFEPGWARQIYVKKIIIAFPKEPLTEKNLIDVMPCALSVKRALLDRGFPAEAMALEKKDFRISSDNIQKKISGEGPCLVFNLFDGFSDDSAVEAEFVRVLEKSGFPFTGNNSRVLDACLDKRKAKEILRGHGINTPEGIFVDDLEDGRINGLTPPVFIKPCFEDGSMGIDKDTLVTDKSAIRDVLRKKLKAFPRGVIAEEFIPGKEYYAAFLGTYPYESLGVSVMDYSAFKSSRPFLSYDAKWKRGSEEYEKLMPSPSEHIDENTRNKVLTAAVSAGKALGCGSYFRVDMREKNGEIFVLDVNPNPDISIDSGFMKQAYHKGHTYAEVIEKIVGFSREINISACADIAQNTGVFKSEEILVLKELLEDYLNNPSTTYIVFEEKEDSRVTGFAVFGKTPMTKFSWDIYWIVSDKNARGKGVATRLLKRVEDFAGREDKHALIRVETSSKEEYAPARNFYLKRGFVKAAVIPCFYDQGDDLETFYKSVDY
jgi:D-alanine-D-alanine ligase